MEQISYRNPALDLLRGIAVLMVLITHVPLPESLNHSIARFTSLGSYGVDLFFVLSGLLISGLIFTEFKQKNKLNLTRFWMRRGLKIWPSYYVAYGIALLFTCFVELVINHSSVKDVAKYKILAAAPNYVFLQTYWRPSSRWFASWSLAVEEHFYLIIPLLLLGLAKVRWLRLGVPVLCLCVCILALFCRIYSVNRGGNELIYIQTHYRADSLCFGVLLGYVSHYHKHLLLRVPKSGLLMCCFFLLALIIPFFYPWGNKVTETIGLTIMYLCFGSMIIIAVAYPSIGSNLTSLIRLGVYSYTIYLAQAFAVVLISIPLFNNHRWMQGVLFFILSIIGGILLSHTVERPFLVKREKWYPKTLESRSRVPLSHIGSS